MVLRRRESLRPESNYVGVSARVINSGISMCDFVLQGSVGGFLIIITGDFRLSL